MSQGLRILVLATGAFGDDGGIASYNRALCRALAGNPEVESVLVLPRRGASGETPPKVRQLAPIGNQLVYCLKAMALAVRVKPDLVFCGHLNMGWLGMILARIVRAQLVLQAHGIETWSRPASRRRRAAPAEADLVFCVSRDTRERLLAWSDIAPEKVVVVANTVSAAFSPGDREAVRRRLGFGGERVILSVGRLDAAEHYKGQDLAIGLMDDLRARGHDALLIIAGDGDDRPRLEALARARRVGERVRFLGQVCDDALLDLYRAADLYLMPSKGEGFGIVFLEAMACGTPAIGLAEGGAPDALGRGLGQAVAEGELLEAVDRVLRRPAADRGALSDEVHRRYGEAVFAQRIASVLGRLRGP